MQNEFEQDRPATEQIRDARDLLTRLYREIGISAVAAALEIRKDRPPVARPIASVMQNVPQVYADPTERSHAA